MRGPHIKFLEERETKRNNIWLKSECKEMCPSEGGEIWPSPEKDLVKVVVMNERDQREG